MNLRYRENTDDDKWVIPEIIDQDMYKIRENLSKIGPVVPSYILDCGAHIGAFSIMCARHIKNVKILAFEPNPDSYSYLKDNTGEWPAIRPINKAVDIQEGYLNLYAPNEDEWSGRWTSLPNDNDFVRVESVNLLQLLRELDRPVYIMKLDIEGYEEFILQHCQPEDLRRVEIMVIETHTDSFDHKKLEELGFSILYKPDIGAHRHFIYGRTPLPL